MSVKDVLTLSRACALRANQPVKDAIGIMVQERVNHLPVCDAQGRYFGLVTVTQIMHYLLPESAAALPDLRFAGDSEDVLKRRLAQLEERPLSQVADRTVAPLDENCPLLEAVLLLSKHEHPLPVIDANGRVLGMLGRRALINYLYRERTR